MGGVVARSRTRVRRRRGAVLLVAAMLTAALGGSSVHAQSAPGGIDVSNWQRQIDWLQVGAAGYDFVFAKATESTTFSDATYPINRSGAGAFGLKIGAYHFARPAGGSDAAVAASAVAQADYFVGYAQPKRGDLLPVLDLEKTGDLSRARLTAWTQAWLDEVNARLGFRPIIYVSPSFWKTSLGDTPIFAEAGHPLWIAHWTKAALPILPGAGWGGLGWLFWQWTDCAKVAGITGCVDGDRFNGSSLASGTIPAYPSGPPGAAAPPTIVGTPQAGQLLAAIRGGWSGGKPVSFAYQWQSCDAAGGGCTPITGAVKQTYQPTAADVGHAIVVAVTAQTSSATATAVSPPTLAVASSGTPSASAPVPTSPPAIQGTAQAGQILSALAGTWTGSPGSFAYQWRRCPAGGGACAAIPAAGGSSYTITPGDIGASLSLVVTATGRGGSRSATARSTPVVLPAPVPAPAVGSAVAQFGQAGAVTTLDQGATATWQPGAVPAQATVKLESAASRLALRGSPVTLAVDAPAPLAWPLDLQYASAPADAVPGFLPGQGVWQPVAELPALTLPAGQEIGAYRDASGALHVLTRRPGRIGLFTPGRWGDPRFVSATRAKVTVVNGPAVTRRADGVAFVYGRLTLDSQAHLYASVTTPGGTVLLSQQGSRLGVWLKGRPAKTLQALQLRPGALPFRLRLPARRLAAKGRYTLRIAAVDPYGRRSTLLVRFAPTR
jgi:GH25 family lysozyme M1 (1,4-beta-N-acetylmuramidase)